MKKVLLSLSMLAAVMTASAQNQIVLWNSTTGTSAITGVPYNFGVPDSDPNDPNVANPPAINGGLFVDTVTVGGVQTITATGSRSAQVAGVGGYYVGGFGGGSYSEPEVGQPWGTNVTGSGGSLANYFFNIKIKSASPGPIIKVQLESKDSANVQGYIINRATGTPGGNYKTISIPLSAFSNTIGAYGDPINKAGHYMTAAFADSLFKIGFSVNNAGLNNGAGSVTFSITDIWISKDKTGIVTSTTSAAANIESTKVFPNPATEAFTAEVSLKNNSNVTIILSDMMGKQIATKSAANGSAAFETASLAKGMYTVTYVLDGTPAKTELVVVK